MFWFNFFIWIKLKNISIKNYISYQDYYTSIFSKTSSIILYENSLTWKAPIFLLSQYDEPFKAVLPFEITFPFVRLTASLLTSPLYLEHNSPCWRILWQSLRNLRQHGVLGMLNKINLLINSLTLLQLTCS